MPRSWRTLQRQTAGSFLRIGAAREPSELPALIKNSLENAGLPTMVLDGDGCNPANSSDGQVSTRLQAYLEMLSEGKEEKRS